MPRKEYVHTEATFQKWIKEGRGTGHGRDYKPWLTVRDIPSRGRSHKLFGHKAQRIHHLLSDIELAAFLLLEWQSTTLDIREQFPLQRDSTLRIAKQNGIAHPSVKGVSQIMSSDFLVDTSHPTIPRFAIQAKSSSELLKPRTIEKLEIERRFWREKGIPWHLITEKDISSTVFRNIQWLYPTQREAIPFADLVHRIHVYNQQFSRHPTSTLIDIAKTLDAAYTLPTGHSLHEIRELLAHRFFIFDLHKANHKITPADLLPVKTEALEVLKDVQNQ